MDYSEKIWITIGRLEKLESDSRELVRARALIARLRAENEVLRDEKRRFAGTVESVKRHISIAGNPSKKWAVMLVKKHLEKAKLL